MGDRIVYRDMQAGEEGEVSDLIARVFEEFIAPGYTEEGRQEFLRYARAGALLERMQAGNATLVACAGSQIVGVLQARDGSHISMLFVEKAFQGRGISRALLSRAIALARKANPDVAQMTLNSSPYALPIYEKLGFRATTAEQIQNGIRFTPMALDL